MGYTISKSDAGVYVGTDERGEKSYILVYLDVLSIVSEGTQKIERCKKMVLKNFNTDDLGEIKDFLGCQLGEVCTQIVCKLLSKG